MFKNISEDLCNKVYDWISNTYYPPHPTWSANITDERELAIHALNDMRALFSGVGNNGWWDPECIYHLEDLRDITPYSMDEVLLVNSQLEKYYKKREEKQIECFTNDEEFDWDKFKRNNAPEVEKMQGNKDGQLYQYAKGLFWDSVEWFITNYATDKEQNELNNIIKNENL